MPDTAPRPRYNSRAEAMTPQEIAGLQARVPDDPVPLPPGHLACPSCGVAVPAASPPPLFTDAERLAMGWGTRTPERYARCPACRSVREAADAYVTAHPLLARRVGDATARDRVESVLLGLAVLGQDPADQPGDLGLLLPRMLTPAAGVRFRTPTAMTRGLCSPRPFAHVTTGQRAALRAGYAQVLADRLALAAPPVPLPCPTGGCLLCGIGTVTRSAIEVGRQGGRQAVGRAVWRPVTASPDALGRRGPERVRGHLCPDCAEAVEAEGAIGPSAVERATLALLRRSSDTRADRLRSLLADAQVRLAAWAAQPPPRVPNQVPFGHLRKVLDRL